MMIIAFMPLVGCFGGDTEAGGTESGKGESSDSATDVLDYATGSRDPGGGGLAACAYGLVQAARSQVGADAYLLFIGALGAELDGGFGNCQADVYAPAADSVFWCAFANGEGSCTAKDVLPNDSFEECATVSWADVIAAPPAGWTKDTTDVFPTAFAGVDEIGTVDANCIAGAILPAIVTNDPNFPCALEWADPTPQVSPPGNAVMVGQACGHSADGVTAYSAWLADAGTGEVLRSWSGVP